MQDNNLQQISKLSVCDLNANVWTNPILIATGGQPKLSVMVIRFFFLFAERHWSNWLRFAHGSYRPIYKLPLRSFSKQFLQRTFQMVVMDGRGLLSRTYVVQKCAAYSERTKHLVFGHIMLVAASAPRLWLVRAETQAMLSTCWWRIAHFFIFLCPRYAIQTLKSPHTGLTRLIILY